MNHRQMADWGHRVHILLTAVDINGEAECFITGKKYHYKDLDVAHLFDRKWLNTRFNYKNTKLINSRSNQYDCNIYDKDKYGSLSKHHFEYTSRFLKVYNKDVYERLRLKSKKQISLSISQLSKRINEYKHIALHELENSNLNLQLKTDVKKFINGTKKIKLT